MEYSRSTVQNVPFFILAVLGANLLLILFLAVLSGYRLYEGLRPIAYGLDRLVDGRRVAVPKRNRPGMCQKLEIRYPAFWRFSGRT